MKNSVIINFIILFFKKLLVFYDNSLIEKIIASLCGFFKKKSLTSGICNLFRNKFLNGSFWRESILFKIVTSPVRLIFAIGKRSGAKIKEIKNKSIILEFINMLVYVPAREYGIMLLIYAAGSFITAFITQSLSRLNIICTAAIFIIGLFALIIPCSVKSLCINSRIFRFFAGLFSFSDEEKTYNIPHFKVFCAASFIFGLIAGLLSPAVLIISVIGAIVVILVLENTMAGVLLSVFSAPILPTMLCAGLVLLTAVSFVLKLLTDDNKSFFLTPMSFLIIMFLALAAFSAVTSFDTSSSIKILFLYIAFALLYFIIVNTVKTKEQWQNLVTVFAMSGFIVALYGVCQNFFMDTTTTSSWVDSEMFSEIGVRVYSFFENPNVLGQYLVLVIPVTFALLLSSDNISNRIILFVVFVLMCACLVFTWSRAAWVAIVLALGFFIVMKDRRWSTLLIVALLILPFFLPESIMSRITSIGDMKDSSSAYRASVWIASARMAKDYWLTGIGIGTGAFEKIYQNYALGGAGFALHSHNFYIQLVVEMGIFGLLVFIGIIFNCFKQIASIKDKKSSYFNIALAIGGALLGYMFQGVAENLWYNYHMVLIFFIYLALLQTASAIPENSLVMLDTGKEHLSD